MVFSDPIYKQGIIEEIDFLINTDASSYPTSDKTRNINRWYERVIGWILDAGSSRLQFDDSKYTTLPVATADIEAGVSVYPFDADWLSVSRVDLNTAPGVAGLRTLTAFDQADVLGAYDAFLPALGFPRYYDIHAGTIILKPTPNYSLQEGLKVWFTRRGKLFSPTDTGEPGFASQFHRILSLGAAYDYAVSRSLPQANAMRGEIEQMHKELEDFYGALNKEPLRIVPKIRGFNPAR